MKCEHEWKEERIKNKNFGVILGAIRTCSKCGEKQFADYAKGRHGSGWQKMTEHDKTKSGRKIIGE